MGNIAAAGKKRMKLGFNFMWAFNRYGTYFGPHVGNPTKLGVQPGSQDSPENWTTQQIRDPKYRAEGGAPEELQLKDDRGNLVDVDGWVEAFPGHMRYLRNALKIDIVRIFLLCNAQNYGSLDGGAYVAPAFLHPRFPWHFKKILDGAKYAGLQLIPSLIDFGIGHPDWGGCQRWQILTDSTTFYEKGFKPLLEISKGYKETIYAWEVMNEPSWLNAIWWPNRMDKMNPLTWLPTVPYVSEDLVKRFLKRGTDLIEAAGFESTVGHRYFSDLKKYPTGTIPQFHYYPNSGNPVNDDPKAIPDALASGLSKPPIFGEFGTHEDQGHPWDELTYKQQANTPDRVCERLKLLQRKNYGLAMIWPDGADPTDTLTDPLKLTSDCELGITNYLDYFNLR